MDEMPDLGHLLEQAMQLQQQLVDAQAEAQATEVEGRAGGGSVRVTMTGGGEVLRVRIDPSVVQPDDVELLEDLVLAALHDAAARARDVQAGAMGGLDLGDLGGLGAGLGGGALDVFGVEAVGSADEAEGLDDGADDGEPEGGAPGTSASGGPRPAGPG
jgi:DNA-binding YbaB/EbfC family protein